MSEIVAALSQLIGSENVSNSEQDRTLYAQDVFTKSIPASAVVHPQSIDMLSKVIAFAASKKLPVVPRGGGMSYSSGYVSGLENAIMVDIAGVNQIVEINTEDMYVTVEAGCSWEKLHLALKDTGLRTPFWGTLSGRFATVGGTMSQNSMFWGSGKYGISAESVVSLSVILADGSSLETGSASRSTASPWFRNFGPDLTGLFLGDCGALGFKATATLKLIPAENENIGLSFAGDTSDAVLAFSSDVSRHGLASEVVGFDPFLQEQRLKRESLAKDVKALAGVMKSAGGITKALKAGAKVAMAGRGYMKDVKFSAHALVQEAYASVAKEKAQEIRKLAEKHGLREIDNSIPTIMRANPFGPVNTMIGPEAERWVPVHCVVPHSKAIATYNAIEDVFENHKALIEKHNIGCGYLLTTIGTSSTLIEPVFFWPDELNELHRHAVEDSHLSKLKEFDANEEARAAVTKIRSELYGLFNEVGAIHFQLGRAYPYTQTLSENAKQLVESIKAQVDPDNIVNTGVLGL